MLRRTGYEDSAPLAIHSKTSSLRCSPPHISLRYSCVIGDTQSQFGPTPGSGENLGVEKNGRYRTQSFLTHVRFRESEKIFYNADFDFTEECHPKAFPRRQAKKRPGHSQFMHQSLTVTRRRLSRPPPSTTRPPLRTVFSAVF